MEIGSKAVDRITGFSGTVTARIEYMGGDVQFLVENAFDCKLQGEWFRESRLEVPATETAA